MVRIWLIVVVLVLCMASVEAVQVSSDIRWDGTAILAEYTVDARPHADVTEVKLYANDAVVNATVTGEEMMIEGTLRYFPPASGVYSMKIGAVRTDEEIQSNIREIVVDVDTPVVRDLVLERHGEPIGAIASRSIHPVDVRFKIDEMNLASVISDFRELNIDPGTAFSYRSIDAFPHCTFVENESFYECIVPNLILKVDTQSITLNITAADTFGNEEEYAFTISFDIDDTSPTVVSITTEHCDGETCYLQNDAHQQVTIVMQDTRATFEKGLVFFSLGQRLYYTADDCTGMTCSGIGRASCSDEQMIPVTLVSAGEIPSQDDAGNPVIMETEEFLTCLSSFPQPNGTNVAEERELSFAEISNALFIDTDHDYGLITDQSTITIRLYVEQPVVGLTAKLNVTALNGEDIQSTECQPYKDNIFECVWTVSNLIPSSTDKPTELVFELENLVGMITKFSTKQYAGGPLVVLGTLLGDDDIPNFFNLELVDVYPSSINRIALQLAMFNQIDFPLSAVYKVVKSSGQGGLSIVHQEIVGCLMENIQGEYYHGAGFEDFTIANPDSDWNEYEGKNRIDFFFQDNIDTNDFLNEFNMKCNISFVVKKGDEIYEQREENEVIIPLVFRESALGTPGQNMVKGIKRMEDDFLVKSKLIGFVNDFLGTFSQICSLEMYSAYFGSGVSVVEMANRATDGLLQPVMNVLSPMARNLNDKTSAADTETIGGGIKKLQDKLFSNACSLVTCDIGNRFDKKIEEAVSAGDEDPSWPWDQDKVQWLEEDSGRDTMWRGFKRSVISGIDTPNVKNSMIQSVLTSCWPAVIYHVNQYRENNCQILTCMKRNAQYGLDVSSCESAKSVYLCKSVIGEIYEAPYIRQIKNLADNFNELVVNAIPHTLLGLLNDVCRRPGQGGGEDGVQEAIGVDAPTQGGGWDLVCEIPRTWNKMLMHESRTRQTRSFVYPVDEDVCATALCNEDRVEDCEPKTNSWLHKYLGRVPTPVDADDLLERIRQRDAEQKEKSQPEITLNDKKIKEIEMDINYLKTLGAYGRSQTLSYPKSDNELEERLRDYYEPDPSTERIDQIKEAIDYRHDHLMSITPKRMRDAIDSAGGTIDSIEKIKNINSNLIMTRGEWDKVPSSLEDLDVDLRERDLSAEDLQEYDQNLQQQIDGLIQLENEVNFLEHAFDARDIFQDPSLVGPNQEERATRATELSIQIGNRVEEIAQRLDITLTPDQLEKIKSDDIEIRKNAIDTFRKDYEKRLTDVETTKSKYKDQQKIVKKRIRAEKTRMYIQAASRLVWNFLVRNHLSLSAWGKMLGIDGLDEIEDWANTYLNSENWRNSYCNPNNQFLQNFGGGNAQGGSTFICDSNGCRIALQQVIERIPFNYTETIDDSSSVNYWLYTTSFFIGPVTEETPFTIFLDTDRHYNNGNEHYIYGPGKTIGGQTFTSNWRTLHEGEHFENALSFLSPRKYVRMCFEFKNRFPPGDTFMRDNVRQERGGNDVFVYCRDVAENAFATGLPPEPTSSNNGLGVSYFDITGDHQQNPFLGTSGQGGQESGAGCGWC